MKRVKLRLKHYDYSQQGLYFITICSQNKACLFGEINKSQMYLNEAGSMIESWYYELENKFSSLKCKEMVIMPNHIHFILELENDNSYSSISTIIQWYKTMTTNDYIKNVKTNNWIRFDKQLWQRGFYDHVIRNNSSHNKIIDYIKQNPIKWTEDKYYKMVL